MASAPLKQLSSSRREQKEIFYAIVYTRKEFFVKNFYYDYYLSCYEWLPNFSLSSLTEFMKRKNYFLGLNVILNGNHYTENRETFGCDENVNFSTLMCYEIFIFLLSTLTSCLVDDSNTWLESAISFTPCHGQKFLLNWIFKIARRSKMCWRVVKWAKIVIFKGQQLNSLCQSTQSKGIIIWMV